MSKSDHEAFVVPMPRDPQTDKLYVAENLQATMWVQGSPKAKAMQAWLESNRIAQTDPDYMQEAKDTQLANSYWTEEIYNADRKSVV